jgi:hypothetical protein
VSFFFNFNSGGDASVVGGDVDVVVEDIIPNFFDF